MPFSQRVAEECIQLRALGDSLRGERDAGWRLPTHTERFQLARNRPPPCHRAIALGHRGRPSPINAERRGHPHRKILRVPVPSCDKSRRGWPGECAARIVPRVVRASAAPLLVRARQAAIVPSLAAGAKSRSRRLLRARSRGRRRTSLRSPLPCTRASWREPAASFQRNRRSYHSGQLGKERVPTALGSPHPSAPARSGAPSCCYTTLQQPNSTTVLLPPFYPAVGVSRWTTWRVRRQPATATPGRTSERAMGVRTAWTCTLACKSCFSLTRFYPASQYLGTSVVFRRLPSCRSLRYRAITRRRSSIRHRTCVDDSADTPSNAECTDQGLRPPQCRRRRRRLGLQPPPLLRRLVHSIFAGHAWLVVAIPQGAAADSCLECGAAQGHFAHDCPNRFVRVLGKAQPGWLHDGSKDLAQWVGTELTAAARADYRRFLTERPVPSHHVFYISMEEIVGPQPPPLRRASVAGR